MILGNDAPSGTGVVPLGILRLMAHLASLGGVAPEIAVALATGNTARVHGLDTGVVAPGRAADIVHRRRAGRLGRRRPPSRRWRIGDLPGVSMVLIDGDRVIGRSRNTPPAGRMAEVVKGTVPPAGGH